MTDMKAKEGVGALKAGFAIPFAKVGVGIRQIGPAIVALAFVTPFGRCGCGAPPRRSPFL